VAYATPADIDNIGIAHVALDKITNEAKLAALSAASALADGYLSFAGCTVPVPSGMFTDALKQCVAIIAAYHLLSVRGYGPEKAGGDNLRKRYEDQIAWLQAVAAKEVAPPCDESGGADPTAASSRGDVISSSSRGYSERDTGEEPGPFVGD
jgi:phage gp36-like protein